MKLTSLTKWKKGLPGLLALVFTLAFSGCGDNVEYVEEEQVEFTKGLITHMEEVEEGQFKIIDEEVVENKADSRIITTYLDGTRDTVPLADMQNQPIATSASDTSRHHQHYHARHSVLMYGLMGYYMGRSSSVPPSPGAYRDQSAYSRVVNSSGETLNQTARRTTVRKPVSRSSGFGTGKSTRSYGG